WISSVSAINFGSVVSAPKETVARRQTTTQSVAFIGPPEGENVGPAGFCTRVLPCNRIRGLRILVVSGRGGSVPDKSAYHSLTRVIARVEPALARWLPWYEDGRAHPEEIVRLHVAMRRILASPGERRIVSPWQ